MVFAKTQTTKLFHISTACAQLLREGKSKLFFCISDLECGKPYTKGIVCYSIYVEPLTESTYSQVKYISDRQQESRNLLESPKSFVLSLNLATVDCPLSGAAAKPYIRLHLLLSRRLTLTHYSKQKLRQLARSNQSPCRYPLKSTYRRQTSLWSSVVTCDFFLLSIFSLSTITRADQMKPQFFLQ